MKRLGYKVTLFFLVVLLLFQSSATFIARSSDSSPESPPQIQQWITTGDQKKMFSRADDIPLVTSSPNVPTIQIDRAKQFQSIDGFGYTLTGGSAYLLHQKLDLETRKSLLKELFLTNHHNIGVSYLRISIGSSDLDEHPFTYNDLPSGATDEELQHFTLAQDQKFLIPILREILTLVPDIKIMGSPWSAPAWMKTNKSLKGGSLDKKCYPVYAEYFVKYIEGMKRQGITIDAITIQNEPENPKNNPSMVMTAAEQTDFVKNYLGPAFQSANIKTKIIVFDHNCDHPEYPINILNDAVARKYIDGTAFHLYLGKIDALSKVQEKHPDKHVYFTEQWTSSEGSFQNDLMWHVNHLIIGATRNWSRNVLEWNLAADPLNDPHTNDGGCTTCLGALTIGDSLTRNVSYYVIAHASKFIRPGSIRISSSMEDDLPNAAFVTPEGSVVLVVANNAKSIKKFAIQQGNQVALASLPAASVATYVW